MGRWSVIGCAVSAAVFFTACTGDSFYRRVRTVDGDCWLMGEVYSFEVPAADTAALYDVYVDLRTSDGYPWRNIFVIGEIGDSASTFFSRDTLRCVLFDSLGRATGHGLSNVKENGILWKKGFRFPAKGRYVFSLCHGMRNVELPGVSSVGIRIQLPESQ